MSAEFSKLSLPVLCGPVYNCDFKRQGPTVGYQLGVCQKNFWNPGFVKEPKFSSISYYLIARLLQLFVLLNELETKEVRAQPGLQISDIPSSE